MGKGRRLKERRRLQAQQAVSLQSLQNGIPIGRCIHVRLARHGADDDAVRSYLRAAINPGPDEDDYPLPPNCSSILAGIADGKSAFTRELAAVLARGGDQGPAVFTLVAENTQEEVVGAIVCSPPFSYIDQIIRARPDIADHLRLAGVLGVSKIIGVAVREDLRGTGVGTALIQTADKVLVRCGASMIMYGSCRTDLVPFYRRLGFVVAAKSHPVSLWVVFGIDAVLSAPGEHIFIKNRLDAS